MNYVEAEPGAGGIPKKGSEQTVRSLSRDERNPEASQGRIGPVS